MTETSIIQKPVRTVEVFDEYAEKVSGKSQNNIFERKCLTDT